MHANGAREVSSRITADNNDRSLCGRPSFSFPLRFTGAATTTVFRLVDDGLMPFMASILLCRYIYRHQYFLEETALCSDAGGHAPRMTCADNRFPRREGRWGRENRPRSPENNRVNTNLRGSSTTLLDLWSSWCFPRSNCCVLLKNNIILQ